MVTAILNAAGSSSRFISSTTNLPKQLCLLNDIPVFLWSLNTFSKIEYIDQILLMVSQDIKTRVQEYINSKIQDQSHKLKICLGGESRQESVKLALDELTNQNYQDKVIIHDTARPFVTKSIIDEVYYSLKSCKASTASIKVVDTLKKVNTNNSYEYINRENCFLIQTPQGFEFKTLYQCHLKAIEDKCFFTDDTSLVENYGEKISLTNGSILNFKITFANDLILGQEIAKTF